MKQEVVRIDEESLAAMLLTLEVIESRHRGQDQRARSGRATGPPHDHADAVGLSEPGKEVLKTSRATSYLERKRPAGQLLRGVHQPPVLMGALPRHCIGDAAGRLPEARSSRSLERRTSGLRRGGPWARRASRRQC